MNNGTVLLLGSGGREHALASKLVESSLVERLISAPGNPGMAALGEVRNVNPEDVEDVLSLAAEIEPELIVVGPEAPIAAGVPDVLRDAGYHVFAPSKAAGRLEWDKAFAKDFMNRHNIPTSASRTFSSDEVEAARDYVRNHTLPVVIKANGLAAGKGVVIAESVEDALEGLEEMLSGSAFGEAGHTVVIEEFMEGEEASIFAVSDGSSYVLFAPSQDHKRIGDGDTGPNTGGMGAYAPAPIVDDGVLRQIREKVVEPALQGMRAEGTPYQGCLYCGLMVDSQKNVRVVEFNSRFGDPETQVVLPIWRGDLFQLFRDAASGNITEANNAPSVGSAVCVVMASGGYPGSYKKGEVIEGIENVPEDVTVFHAGTAEIGGDLVTAGGRVLGVTAISGDADLERTIEAAYKGVEKITFHGGVWRRDIGKKGVRV